MALEPYNAVAGPLITSIPPACSKLASNSSLTLQKPGARRLMPSAAVKKAPQLPGPVNTGERRAIRLSWPLPRLIQAPGTRCMIWLMCTGATSFRSSLRTFDQASGSSRAFSGTRLALTMTVSSSLSTAAACVVHAISNSVGSVLRSVWRWCILRFPTSISTVVAFRSRLF